MLDTPGIESLLAQFLSIFVKCRLLFWFFADIVYFLVVVIIIHELDILSYHFENPMFVFVGHFKVIYWTGGILLCAFLWRIFFSALN